jgi:SAM-dependent methyltransferase
MSDEFKYVDRGAYHWGFTYNPKLRRYDPRNHARYDVPLRLLRGRLPLATSRGLEVGCGDGVLLYKAMLGGAAMIGVDMSRTGLTHARQQIASRLERAPQLVRASALELPFRDGSFDYVLSVEVIEHLDEVDRYLAEIRRVLRPGGLLAVTTPHRLASGELQDPYHVREYDGGALRAELARHFASVEVYGMYPEILDRMYYRASGVKVVDQLVRGGFKVLAKWVANPYERIVTAHPDYHWGNLVAVARA